MALYYIGDVAYDSNYLAHHGIKGQKWGVRRYQNPDGTWTEEGKKRYGGDSNGFNEDVDKYHKKSENQARWRENKEANRQKMWEARDRYAKKATNNYEDGDNQDFLFTEDGGSVKNQKDLSSRDAMLLRDIVRTAGDRAKSAQLQYKDAKSAKGLFGENAKIRKNADKVYREKVDDYFSDLFGETADYVEKMPKEMRDAAYAYVYEMWGFNY